MSNVLIPNQATQGVGLQSYTYTIPAAQSAYPFGGAGLYNVQVQTTVQNSVIGNGAGSAQNQQALQSVTGSGLSYVVNQNGSPVYTSPSLTPFQIAEQAKVELLCAVNDVITVVFSSSQTIDQQLNSVSSIVSINQGA